MEGWDGTREGEPSELTVRRWRNFGRSGAKLIWGGEAVAVRHDGRANPHQLLLTPATLPAIAGLRRALIDTHVERFGAGSDDDLYVGLQLTHSGRFSKPDLHERPEPLAAVANPVLDRRFANGVRVLTDAEITRLIDDFVGRGAARRRSAGFSSWTSSTAMAISVTSCSAPAIAPAAMAAASRTAPGSCARLSTAFARQSPASASSFDSRCSISSRIGRAPAARVCPKSNRRRIPPAFGLLEDGNLDAALEESRALLRMLEARDVRWVCVTGRSPVLLPACAATGALSSERRLRTAGGSAARRGATDCRDRAAEGGFPRDGDRRLRLHLPAGVAAARRAVQRARRAHRFRRPRAA